jgi:hypothetical protein
MSSWGRNTGPRVDLSCRCHIILQLARAAQGGELRPPHLRGNHTVHVAERVRLRLSGSHEEQVSIIRLSFSDAKEVG